MAGVESSFRLTLKQAMSSLRLVTVAISVADML
uniref:Uncharacterized protein n=1 Tax=Mycolicibacterium neoaurum VKM Ac-1815D TaxID=700508 RepID=V5XH51_MYCNE